MNDNVAKNAEAKIPVVAPATDILEMEDGFHILVDLPGVPKENLVIDLKEDEVTIRAASTYEPPAGAKGLYAEFEASEFSRTFSLSDVVDRERIKAAFHDGVLNLFLPKAEKVRPRKIEISSD